MLDKEKVRQLWPMTCHGRWMSEEYVPGLVSVIIPTWNRAHMVTEAMDSIWAQTYRPIELIVVDDGSTDDTPQVLEDWGRAHAGDPQFELRTFRQDNKGAPAAGVHRAVLRLLSPRGMSSALRMSLGAWWGVSIA